MTNLEEILAMLESSANGGLYFEINNEDSKELLEYIRELQELEVVARGES